MTLIAQRRFNKALKENAARFSGGVRGGAFKDVRDDARPAA
jgi:hypothetical protein